MALKAVQNSIGTSFLSRSEMNTAGSPHPAIDQESTNLDTYASAELKSYHAITPTLLENLLVIVNQMIWTNLNIFLETPSQITNIKLRDDSVIHLTENLMGHPINMLPLQLGNAIVDIYDCSIMMDYPYNLRMEYL
ncbi:hypothetical protein T310_7500 [Rasamsonia emersonii CBS 393.64]|uniref:Uncharacterized protein n=1 Tax=Rasamsonia emersonii (strain ATCC 16479 / CBS 393.64 / IMI 116815) TaxID=1408163 RepID=A0A0F4YK84_RASE3|nr:hypothetical protein T310_7500 [Rasamsonia emersonii CBS 393.64]KKA18545.1 hypothetical protein T310_7500 [Rasamsonia emersonii CBS 393.64]